MLPSGDTATATGWLPHGHGIEQLIVDNIKDADGVTAGIGDYRTCGPGVACHAAVAPIPGSRHYRGGSVRGYSGWVLPDIHRGTVDQDLVL